MKRPGFLRILSAVCLSYMVAFLIDIGNTFVNKKWDTAAELIMGIFIPIFSFIICGVFDKK